MMMMMMVLVDCPSLEEAKRFYSEVCKGTAKTG